MPNGRVDHSFLFEHNLQDIGEAKYRLRATVSGSVINSVSPFAFVPESFKREFANIRSDNDTIAIFANFAFLGLYLSRYRDYFIGNFLQKRMVEMEKICCRRSFCSCFFEYTVKSKFLSDNVDVL